ncbi:MAG TPA: ecotin family protein [Crocinitomicaceae bacterium]|nr:ecotin family protein [Crocinitomicaceae bacterium]
MKNTFLASLLTFFSLGLFAQNTKDISMFPEPTEGFKKVVIYLPEKKNEDLLQLEIVVGKNAEVDKCNNHFLMGDLKEMDLSGWGYTYYNFKSSGDIAGTKMGCPTNETVTKFVMAKSKIIRYNSKIPVVIYVPNGTDVKYKVWKTKAKWTPIK